jgi:phage shock protein E
MVFELLKKYWPLLLFVCFLSYRLFKSHKAKLMIVNLMKDDAQIIDVRSNAEFIAANNPVSKNIPLDTIRDQFCSLSKETPIILCCASGARSGLAKKILLAEGFDAHNGGSWRSTII